MRRKTDEFHEIILWLMGLKYPYRFHPVNKNAPGRRMAVNSILRITLLFFREAWRLSPMSMARRASPFVLYLIELPFQLVDQIVDWGVHIFSYLRWRPDGCSAY